MVNPYRIVSDFEETIAEWAGAPYAVAVESCTAALFLCCIRRRIGLVNLPKYTYPGVACSIIHAGGRIKFTDEAWQGVYKLEPYDIIDGALRLRGDMYSEGLHCLSFHNKKLLPIGRGGMILCSNKADMEWFKLARFDGRHECQLKDDNFNMIGWNMYMTPDQAARGMMLFDLIRNEPLDDLDASKQGYPDLSQYDVYKNRITTRRATIYDAWDLYIIKNDPVTRENSIVSNDVIPWDAHLQWLDKTLKNSAVVLKVILDGSKIIGDVRLDHFENGTTEISIRISPAYRGRGIATEIIRDTVKSNSSDDFIAKIIEGNTASEDVFLKNGFKHVVKQGNVNYYHYSNICK
jgi:RimJ/RimL family protein N-acetyltransferase